MINFTLCFLIVNDIQNNMASLDHDLARFAEIHGNAARDIGLHLANAPIGLGWMTHQHSGF
ncbi:hypothetical protein LOKVESSMR4R_01439 [Yoonia vestfoldensis]|uniref:Uncharacterized protein n=1 Tax=Yoonia vestfoldensis TaxID=245188 RepID=A0A1Y0EAW6_9RHOB|nr:hypothetical protein LOKVESSMR4R_01439 [Yoonia vestfoldensis]